MNQLALPRPSKDFEDLYYFINPIDSEPEPMTVGEYNEALKLKTRQVITACAYRIPINMNR